MNINNMKRKGQAVLSPAMIMGVVVSLIILAIGGYAFFTTQNAIPAVAPNNASGTWTTIAQNRTYSSVQNVSNIGNQVMNIVGVVLVIGSIMLIVGMVMGYIRK